VPAGARIDLGALADKRFDNIIFGQNLLFGFEGFTLGIEICEDLWVPIPPSSRMALAGAHIIVNLSCSDEVTSKHAYLRQMIQSRTTDLRIRLCFVRLRRIDHRPRLCRQGTHC